MSNWPYQWILRAARLAAAALIFGSLAFVPLAQAYSPWEWKYGQDAYGTKAQALAAMRSRSDKNALLTKFLGMSSDSGSPSPWSRTHTVRQTPTAWSTMVLKVSGRTLLGCRAHTNSIQRKRQLNGTYIVLV